MSALLICAALLVTVQTPAQRRARAPGAPTQRDTIYVAVQSPPPTVVVEPQSQVLALLLGIAGIVLLLLQLRIMGRQGDAMNRQTSLAEKQTALEDQQTETMNRQTSLLDKQSAPLEQQSVWRRDKEVVLRLS